MHFLRRLYRPEFFQGSGKRGGYFEGWYFIYTFGDSAFALIPGISLAERDRHAFIQVIDGPTGRSAYHRFPAEEFRCRGDRFLLGRNRGRRRSINGRRLCKHSVSGILTRYAHSRTTLLDLDLLNAGFIDDFQEFSDILDVHGFSGWCISEVVT